MDKLDTQDICCPYQVLFNNNTFSTTAIKRFKASG